MIVYQRISTKDFGLQAGDDAASTREHSPLCDRVERGNQRPCRLKDTPRDSTKDFGYDAAQDDRSDTPPISAMTPRTGLSEEINAPVA
jgi:hypothetical protein